MHKHDRLRLLADAAYFASELTRRLEALADIERSGDTLRDWTQAASITRRIRSLCRHQGDEQRRRRRLGAMAR